MSDFRDRDLVRLHWPPELRPAFDALFAVDDAMADVVLRTGEPHLAAIKLAWWREQLEGLDGGPPPSEPRLKAVTCHLLPLGISGATLAALEDGWLELLQSEVNLEAAARRGALLFAQSGRALGHDGAILDAAGELWALADLARRSGREEFIRTIGPLPAVPRQLRPIGAMAALAVRDHRQGFPLEAEATPGRAWALIRHRISGRL